MIEISAWKAGVDRIREGHDGGNGDFILSDNH